jgi:iron complex transport system substrate-binding protein
MTGFRAVSVIAAVVALALTGCGSGGDDTGSESADSADAVTIDHAYGSTEIKGEPTRIVTLGLSDQDPLLALGVAPIAVSPWYGDYEYATWPWAQDELGDATPVVLNGGVRSEEKPPLEEIASLEPDLILSLYNGTTEEQYEQLSAIAPTVVPTEEYTDFNITWQEATRVTGVAIGREQQALDLIAEVEQGFADDAAANPQFAGKNIVVAERFEPGESVVRAGNDVRAKFFGQLGFTLPTDIAGTEPDEYGEIVVSDEFLPELSRDLLVWNVGFAPEERQTVESNPLYPTLPVVESGKVLWVEDPVVSGAFSWGTVLSLDYAREQLVPQIAPLVD